MTRALVVGGAGKLGLEERAALEPAPGSVVVAPRVVGLCGTDLEIVDGAIDPAFVRYPLVLGHEWAGVVARPGDGPWAEGQPVVVEGIVPCRVCAHCVAGDTNLCDTYDEFGFTSDGGAADEILVRADLVHALAPGIDLEHGALVEPASVVYRALARAVAGPGLDCLVVGDGTVGLLAAHLLQLWSPASTVVLGQRPEQETLARAAGADALVDSVAPAAFHLVVEAAGTGAAVESALRAAKRGGTVVLLGLPPHGSTFPIEPADLVNNDLTIQASFGYTSVAWRRVVALVNSGRLRPAFLVTHRFPLERYADAFDALRRPAPGVPRAKVVL
ncbi:MAG: Alcohol dehydrogenase GroES domain protein, partial [Acidimicrobiaceae bacterium]|nr:Alcohol dehydrogenase GroES domain protein [Acidimicrobiaceae bacterium]